MTARRSQSPKQTKDSTKEFTTRGIMSLVAESSEMMESARKMAAVISALALAHGISTDV